MVIHQSKAIARPDYTIATGMANQAGGWPDRPRNGYRLPVEPQLLGEFIIRAEIMGC